MITFLLILFTAAAIVAAVYVAARRNHTEPTKTTEPSVDPNLEREKSIVSLNVLVREHGLQRETDIERLLDDCVSLHEALLGVDVTEQAQLHSAPADFTRLLDKHLPELLHKSVQSGVASADAMTALNEAVTQLRGELQGLIQQIHDRNFADFARKKRFVEIRYSDQY